ncbi:VanZ family protein [Tenacibaculum sp. UWU-22]|uniref:VanZ family protein n=1 Tax=Tenacibaculum sp. UWU-22 TaxID=3234187 RepID=UPI0034DAEBCA
MLKHTKNLLTNKNFYIALFITLLILFLSLIRIGKLPINFSNIDKVEHTIAYSVLTLTWLIALKKQLSRKKTVFIVAFACIIYGIIIEILQGVLTSYRTFDYFDMIANSAGVLIALTIFLIFFNKKQGI